MADKVVAVPGVGNVSFPDSMSDDAISSVIQQQHPELLQQQGLSPQEQQQLQQSLNARPLWRKILGLGSSDPAAQQLQQKGMQAARPDIESGLRDYYQTNPGGMYGMGVASNLAQGAQDFSQGNIKKGIHSTVKGVGIASLPLAAPALAGAPLATVGAAGAGLVGSQIGSRGAKALGASEDTQNLAGDIGGLAAGFAGGYGGSRLSAALPSRAAAGALFNQASSAAGKLPIDTGPAGDVALQMRDLASSGGRQPKVIRDFISRATDPNQGPITYDEARQFYSNAGNLSVNERNGLAPNAQRMLNQFRFALGQSIQGAAEKGGVGQQYRDAMGMWRTISTAEGLKSWLFQNAVKPAAKAAIPAAAGGYGLYKILDSSDRRQK